MIKNDANVIGMYDVVYKQFYFEKKKKYKLMNPKS